MLRRVCALLSSTVLKNPTNNNISSQRLYHNLNRKRKNPPKRQKYVTRRFRPDPKLNVLWGRSVWEAGFSYKLYSEPFHLRWQANTVTASLFSHTLNRYVTIDLTVETLYDIDDDGGIDNYLANRTDEDLNSNIGSRLKKYLEDFRREHPPIPEEYDENGHRVILPTVHAIDLVSFDRILRPIHVDKFVKPPKLVPIEPVDVVEC